MRLSQPLTSASCGARLNVLFLSWRLCRVFIEIAVCFLVYIAIVVIAYCPKNTATTMPETVGHVDYFPESDMEPETLTPSSEIPEMAIAALANPSKPLPIVADEPIAVTVSPTLNSLSIRQLKKMAQGRVKNYSGLTKGQLIQALAA